MKGKVRRFVVILAFCTAVMTGGVVAAVGFTGLAQFDEPNIQKNLSEAFEINMSGEMLEGYIVISHGHSDSLLSNVRGSGSIIIVPKEGSSVFLRNIDIDGRIVITDEGNGCVDLTLQNVRAYGVYVLGDARISFVGENGVEDVTLSSAAVVDTSGLGRRALVPNVHVYSPDVLLYGRFGDVNVRFEQAHVPVVLHVDGIIRNLYSQGDIIVVGDVEFENYNAPFAEFINHAGFYRQMSVADAIETGVAGLVESVLDGVREMLDEHMGSSQRHTQASLPVFIPPSLPPTTSPHYTPPPPADPPPAPQQPPPENDDDDDDDETDLGFEENNDDPYHGNGKQGDPGGANGNGGSGSKVTEPPHDPDNGDDDITPPPDGNEQGNGGGETDLEDEDELEPELEPELGLEPEPELEL